MLVTERGIQAASAQFCGDADVINGRAVVTGGTELPFGSADDFVAVEGPWSCHTHRVNGDTVLDNWFQNWLTL
jgi:hypothetical protein